MSTDDWAHYPNYELREDELGAVHRVICRCGRDCYWFTDINLAIASYANHLRRVNTTGETEQRNVNPVNLAPVGGADVRGHRHTIFRRVRSGDTPPATPEAAPRHYVDRFNRS